MKLGIISTYPPRRCGIANFTYNLVKGIGLNSNSNKISDVVTIIAINDEGQQLNYPDEVKLIIRENHQRDYLNAARYINYSDIDVCIIEHEFGIFGGNDGVYILPLLHNLEVPIIVTLHTVLKKPSFTQKSIIEEIGKKAARIVVMSKLAIDILNETYQIPKEKITLIEHGVPDFIASSREKAKEKFDFVGRKVLLTFGLLSRNKGIETVIYALPEVVKKHPEVLYVVVGATHPNVLKHSGEEYRNFLKMLVNRLHLENNVYFYNEYVSEELLMDFLSATDIYITPYLSEAQITSGTLSYAIGAGCAIVSTPYWHAQEMLSDNRGKLFDFKNSSQLAEILNELLDNENLLNELRTNASEYGKKLRWSKISKQYLFLSEYVYYNYEKISINTQQTIELSILPTYDLSHILRLTDDTGIVQHAKYGIPNLKEGYCLDDNARALLMTLMAYRQNKDKKALELMPIYLSYIHYMQRENGHFRNFLSFNRQYLDEYGSEDSYGRAIWALGYLIRFAPNDAFRRIALDIFYKSIEYCEKINSLRGIANTIIGLSYYLKEFPQDEKVLQYYRKLINQLLSHYKNNSDEDWKWFEDILTYDNAILPMSLFMGYEILGDNEILNVANNTSQFLENLTFKNGYFNPIGNKGWYPRGGKMAEYDQQSIDVMAMVLMYYQKYQITKNKEDLDKLFNTYLWFLGENSLRLPLFDHETKGCCDGLEEQGVNRNQGAESTLAYWISHLTVLSAQQKEYHFKM